MQTPLHVFRSVRSRFRPGDVCLERAAAGTIANLLRCLAAMSTTLREQFETFADCCLELARRADTPAHRSRLMKMAHEYRQATALVSMERQDFGGPSIKRANSFDMLRGPHRHVANEVIRDLIDLDPRWVCGSCHYWAPTRGSHFREELSGPMKIRDARGCGLLQAPHEISTTVGLLTRSPPGPNPR